MRTRTVILIAIGVLVFFWILPVPGILLGAPLANWDAEMLAILMVFGIPLSLIIGGLFITALLILKRGSGSSGAGLSENEGQTIQEIYRGLNRMEKRVEALETILLERTARRRGEKAYQTEIKDAKSD